MAHDGNIPPPPLGIEYDGATFCRECILSHTHTPGNAYHISHHYHPSLLPPSPRASPHHLSTTRIASLTSVLVLAAASEPACSRPANCSRYASSVKVYSSLPCTSAQPDYQSAPTRSLMERIPHGTVLQCMKRVLRPSPHPPAR